MSPSAQLLCTVVLFVLVVTNVLAIHFASRLSSPRRERMVTAHAVTALLAFVLLLFASVPSLFLRA